MLLGDNFAIVKLIEKEAMYQPMDQVLLDLKKFGVKRRLLDEELSKLSPELKAEIEVRKSRLINAMRQRWDLPKESQLLHDKINRKSKDFRKPYWYAISFSLAASLLDHLLISGSHYTVYAVGAFFFAAILQIHNKLDLIEMNQRFSWLSNEIEQAEAVLYTYGGGFIESFGPWHTKDEGLDSKNIDNCEKRYLTSLAFFIDLEESILINMKILTPLQLTLETHGL